MKMKNTKDNKILKNSEKIFNLELQLAKLQTSREEDQSKEKQMRSLEEKFLQDNVH